MEDNKPFSPAMAARGERKKKILDKAEFEKDSITLDWIKTQPTWASDIEYYLKSIEPEEKKTKSKKEK